MTNPEASALLKRLSEALEKNYALLEVRRAEHGRLVVSLEGSRLTRDEAVDLLGYLALWVNGGAKPDLSEGEPEP